MELEGLLQHTKQPATCSYLEPDESSPRTINLFIENYFNIILHLRHLYPSGYFIRTQYVFFPLNPPDQPKSIW